MSVAAIATRPGANRTALHRLAQFARTPKGQLLLILLACAAMAAPFEGGGQAAAALVGPVLVATICDAALTRQEKGRWQLPTGAPLTGLFIAMILAVTAPWYVAAIACVAAMLAKRFVRIGREHVFNPAALGLLAVGLWFGAAQDWWGALANIPAPWMLLLLACGLLLIERLNKLPTVLTFGMIYFGGWTLLSFIDASRTAEMFRPPFLQSASFMALFMLTDPPTSPIRHSDQVYYGAAAAIASIASELLGAGQLFLLIGILIANLWLGIDRVARRLAALETQRS
jgi:Na+-translocating ferredoxin:NAD+ oxidoreductase RnfD subunit